MLTEMTIQARKQAHDDDAGRGAPDQVLVAWSHEEAQHVAYASRPCLLEPDPMAAAAPMADPLQCAEVAASIAEMCGNGGGVPTQNLCPALRKQRDDLHEMIKYDDCPKLLCSLSGAKRTMGACAKLPRCAFAAGCSLSYLRRRGREPRALP